MQKCLGLELDVVTRSDGGGEAGRRRLGRLLYGATPFGVNFNFEISSIVRALSDTTPSVPDQ